MRERITRVRKVERREAPAKPAARMAKGKPQTLAKVLEEWLAEARIRYTHAGE
jgi:flagellar biosynthesis/type III secretory pathway M-ring protein FliF/YscJ